MTHNQKDFLTLACFVLLLAIAPLVWGEGIVVNAGRDAGAMRKDGTNAASVVALPGSLQVGGNASVLNASMTQNAEVTNLLFLPGDFKVASSGLSMNIGAEYDSRTIAVGPGAITAANGGFLQMNSTGQYVFYGDGTAIAGLITAAKEWVLGPADTGPEVLQVTGAASVSGALTVGGNASVTGALEAARAGFSGAIRITSNTIPTSPVGTAAEMLYVPADAAYFQGYDRVGSVYTVLKFRGTHILFMPQGTEAGRFNPSGELQIGSTADTGSEKLQVTGAASISSTLTAGAGIISSGTAPSFALANGESLDVVMNMTATEAFQISVGGGDPAISIASDSKTVEVDSMMFRPRADPPATATEGLVYADTDHHMYYYNGTSWLQLDNAP